MSDEDTTRIITRKSNQSAEELTATVIPPYLTEPRSRVN